MDKMCHSSNNHLISKYREPKSEYALNFMLFFE